MGRKPSWVCTLVTQLTLCAALYVVLNLGQPQVHKSIYQRTSGGGIGGHNKRRSTDFYFISVTGGFRPLKQQTHLLKQMENVAKSYDARFVVNTSELGEDDPLKKNATGLFPSLKVPWYTTKASKEKEIGCFQEQIKVCHGEVLDIIGVDTGNLQETNGNGDNWLNWLTKTLEATNGRWCIVVGFHPLVVCEEDKVQLEANKLYEPLHHIFMKFGVNAYLSKHGCIKYARHDSVTYIENPVLMNSGKGRKMVDGFLLHRVNSLEIETYFITSEGEVQHKTVIRQRGKEGM